MYSKEQHQEIEKLTKELLGQIDQTVMFADATIDQLRKVLRFHDWRYYVQSEAVISDYDYDMLFKFLKKLEEEHPDLVTEDSPTQRVALGLSEGFDTVAHNIPMLSLDNSYNAEDLNDFDERLRKHVDQEDIAYTVEPKFDGSSIALVYENDQLVRAATRGNGVEGEEITNNAKALKSIPLSANFSQFGIAKIEVRGEVVIRHDVFHKINEQREEEGLKTFQNSRNTASGALRLKDPKEAARRGLEAILYQIGYAVDADGNNLLGRTLLSHKDNVGLLYTLGFKVPVEDTQNFDSINGVVDYCKSWEEKRATYNYEIDGMVIKVDDIRQQDQAGFTAHHPRWAIAYKFKAKQAEAKLLDIEYQVGRTGAVTPVAKIEPTPLAGVTISSISLHNEDFIKEKDIRIGGEVIIERAGEVIPYIVGMVKGQDLSSLEPFVYTKDCPICETELVKPEGEAIWRCVNADCPAQIEERIIHFVSKGAMDIEGLGKDIVKRFMAEGLVQHISDIYQLDYEQVLALEGWKEKSVENLRTGVEQSKSQAPWRLLVGLGVRHVGGTTAKMLAKQVQNLKDFAGWSQEQLVELEDVGPKVAESIAEFFHNPSNIELLEELERLGVNLERAEQTNLAPDVLNGQTFLFTGSLTRFTRDEAKELVEMYGGKTISSVSKKLGYLVVGESAGSKLTKAQKINDDAGDEVVKIITEDAFLELIAQ